MSGPPYPPMPGPGSNAIGSFIIGVSQIGDISPFDTWRTIQSEYANSPIIDGIALSLGAALDPTAFFANFYDDIWNVLTAKGYGLDVWGRIVGVTRVLALPTQTWFGFQEASPGASGFNSTVISGFGPSFGFQEASSLGTFGYGTFGLDRELYVAPVQVDGAFYSGSVTTSNYIMSDDAFRALILAKAAANITNGSIPALNTILTNLFPGRGEAYVIEGIQGQNYFGFQEAQNLSGFGQSAFYNGQATGAMTMTYVFRFPLTNVETAIMLSGVLPRSTGVASSIVYQP